MKLKSLNMVAYTLVVNIDIIRNWAETCMF